MSGGTIKCWGAGGTLADGTPIDRWVPTDVIGISDAISIASSFGHDCALVSSGAVKCWGYNWDGQLGDGTDIARWTPVAVAGVSGATAIAATYGSTCALASGGTVKCWGGNYSGQLGDGTTSRRFTPVDVIGVTGATALTAGSSHVCALMSDGAAKCWGNNEFGQLGDATRVSRSTPVDVVNIVGAPAITAGSGQSTCAVMPGGTAKCWGSNVGGQLGDGTLADHSMPVNVLGISGAIGITAGGDGTCALISGGTAKCWGPNNYGAVGDGTASARWIPVDALGVSGATALTAGGYHACALMLGGTAKCWGDNKHGALGDGTRTSRQTPVDVVGLADPTTCTDTYFVGVRGSGEPPQPPNGQTLEDFEAAGPPGEPVYEKGSNVSTTGMGGPVTAVFEEFRRQADRSAPFAKPIPLAVRYPAIKVGDGGAAYPDRYQRSVRIGATQLVGALRSIQIACTKASVVLAGYSQGADVINRAMGEAHRAADAGLFGQVKKIVLIGDPSHRPNRPENVGTLAINGNGNGVSVTAGLADPDVSGFLDARKGLVSSICSIGDTICDTSKGDVWNAIRLITGNPNPHTLYTTQSMKCPAVNYVLQYTTTCGGQILFTGLGYAPTARDEGNIVGGRIQANPGLRTLVVANSALDKSPEGGTNGPSLRFSALFRSDPIDLGTFAVDENGIAVIDFIVPDVPAGEHLLELHGDDGRVYRVPFDVTDEPLGDDPVLVAVDQSSMDTPPTSGPEEPSSGAGSIGSLFGS